MARNTNGEGFSLKDELFNKAKVTKLASELAPVVPGFKADTFVADVCSQFPMLELKERIAHIADVLERYLDNDFKTACTQIVAALPAPLDPTKTDDDFGDFIYAPYGEFVARHGASATHLKTALDTLKELTQRFSMEDAIRTFINAFPEETYATLTQWASDKNYHVRRLVSEGTRPLLPWSSRLTTPIERPLLLLNTLHADAARYVTRSVANHLNDISKREPDLAIATLQRWHQAKVQEQKELVWMTRHALRTLVKQGHPDALAFLGYHSKPQVVVRELSRAPARLALGDTLEFSFTLTAKRNEPLLVDYVVDFVKKNGNTAPKVFKIKQLTLAAGESATITKRHPIKANSSTFTYYPGEHTVTLQINGQQFDSFTFTLK
ncbi:hypothetical protein CL655_02515 [bacterium]|nr:hypothetical protein [bacterium]|tara:strand:- start:2716 stop:3855 length:1140 start_codon:yes stop_codon:yes gene_type:complete